MKSQRVAHERQEAARSRLEQYALEDIQAVLAGLESSGLGPSRQDHLLKRAHTARLLDELRGCTIPSHLYVITELLREPDMPAGVLARFLDGLRELAFAG